MSYNVARMVNPELAICSFSSVAAGNVIFLNVSGGFTPQIAADTITLDAGYEYLLISSPSVTTATSCRHIVNDISETLYSITVTAVTSGLDELTSSILADASATFKLYSDQALTSNSRLQIWRFPL